MTWTTTQITHVNKMNRAAKDVQLGTMLANLGSTTSTRIYADPSGSDTTGDGSIANPVASLTKAMTLVSANRLIIMLAPGEYVEVAPVVWTTTKNAVVMGAGNNCTSISTTGASVITVTPGVQASTFTGHIEGITIDHSGITTGVTHAQSGITFDNTGITRNLVFSIKNCAFSADAITDKSINIATHADADHAVRVYVSGDGTQTEIEGAIYFAVNNLADRLHCEQLWIKGTITTTNPAKEFRMRLYRCIVPYGAATAGGSSTQVITSVNSYSWVDYKDIVPEVYAALATGDLTGSHTEVIVA